MTNTSPLSTDAKNYLCCFYQILDEMTQGVTAASLTHSISHNFIVQMIPHHRAAVRMSDNILRFADNQAVRRLAQRISEEQAQGIAELEAMLSICTQQTNPQLDLRLYQRRMDLIFREMFASMGSAPENNRLSAIYLQEMLPHHRGAVRMADDVPPMPPNRPDAGAAGPDGLSKDKPDRMSSDRMSSYINLRFFISSAIL